MQVHRLTCTSLVLALAFAVAQAWPCRCELQEDTIPDWELGSLARFIIYAQRDLYKAMVTAGQWLDERSKITGKVPESSQDIESLKAEVSALMPHNPFVNDPASKVPVRIVFDDTLNDTMMTMYRVNPPSSWTAKAGTVTIVISPNFNHFLVWAADMNGAPIRHEVTHKVLFVRGRPG